MPLKHTKWQIVTTKYTVPILALLLIISVIINLSLFTSQLVAPAGKFEAVPVVHDLEASYLSCSPKGSNASCTGIVINNGNVAEEVFIAFTLSNKASEVGNVVYSTSISLSPGNSQSVSKDINLVSGTNYITFVVDPANFIPEANEDNNKKIETITLRPQTIFGFPIPFGG
jgi:hypothetical protein